MIEKQKDQNSTLIDVGEKPLIKVSPQIISAYHDENGSPVPGKFIKCKQIAVWDNSQNKWHKIGTVNTVDFVLQQVEITDESQESDYDHSIVTFDPDDFKPYRYFYKETDQRIG